jgi:Holliday junction resolvase-like predicted endonuclease
MPKVFTSKTQKTGEIGENIAVKFLMKQGYKILERNYTRKWGEIDIVAQKGNRIIFIEVKSVASADLKSLAYRREDVSHGTNDDYRAEDNMHPWKLKRLSRTIQTYLLSNKVGEVVEWQVDLVVVFLDLKNKKAKIKTISDIIL